jgi:Protein of unknown function DUF45
MGSFAAASQLSLFGSDTHPQPPVVPRAAAERGKSVTLPREAGRRTEGKKAQRKKVQPAKKRRTDVAVPGGAALCQRIFTRIGCAGPPPAFRVEFYPYSSLTLTVRRRDEEMIVRFSDLLQRAPMAVLEGAAALLLGKIYRRRTPRALVAPYNEYAKSNRTRQRIQNMRCGRVRHASLDATGRHFDMNAMFDDLNARFFAGELRRPHLGWSTHGWRRQFGSYDPGPNQILLNKRMDRPEVPRYVVEYVLYHEMLHVKHPTRKSGCTLLSHSPEFRAEEKRFPEFERARKALDRLAR